MTEVSIGIDGMSCQHCVMRVKRALESISGVRDAAVEVGLAKVTFDESKTGKKEIEDSIIKAGYKIRG